MTRRIYSFRANESLIDEVEQHSQENHTTVSNVIRIALLSYLVRQRKGQNSNQLYL